MTNLGGFCLMMSWIVYAINDITFTVSPPLWVPIASSCFLWIYQQADGLDGKIARNTGTSSSLGQLMDHGWDCIGIVIFDLVLMSAFTWGSSAYSKYVIVWTQGVYFSLFYEEHVTGVLRTQWGGIFGSFELHYIVMALIISINILTPSWFHEPLVSEYPLSSLTNINIASLTLVTILGSCNTIYQTLKTTPISQVLRELFPLVQLVGLSILWFQTPFWTSHTLLVTLTISATFIKTTHQLMICSVCHMPYPAIQLQLIEFGLAGAVFTYGMPILQTITSKTQIFFFAFVGYSILSMLIFIVRHVLVIAQYCDVYVFWPGKKPSKKVQ